MDTIKQLSYFFNLSPKRQGALEKHVMTDYPEAKRTKLIDVCGWQELMVWKYFRILCRLLLQVWRK